MTFARALTFGLAAWAALVTVASLQAVLPVSLPTPDVVLIVVLYVGLSARGQLAGACALALVLGWFADLFAGAPKGLHMAAYALAGLAARGASSRILVRGPLPVALTALIFALAQGALVVVLRTSLQPSLGWGGLRQVPLAALATAILAPLAFRALRRIDRRFTRDPRLLSALDSGGALSPRLGDQ